MIDRKELRDMLVHYLPVYYVKNDDTNRKREKDQEDTAQWLINEYLLGPLAEGTMARPPEFTYTFGDSALWEAEKRLVLYCQPNCAICGAPVKEVHHIRPRFLNGTNHPRNLIGLCLECHDEVHRQLDSAITEAIAKSVPGAKAMHDAVKGNMNRKLEDYEKEVKE